MKKSPITTHILNLDTGKPAVGVRVTLHRLDTQAPVASAMTDSDGRVMNWESTFEIQAGNYLLHFAVAPWYERQSLSNFYPEIQLTFCVGNPQEHYHVPLLLNAYGYSTYRGS